MKHRIPSIVENYTKFSDEELVYRYVRRHENIALEHLFERYGHLVLGICMSYFDTQAASQATESLFIQLTDDLTQFPNEYIFRSWLYKYVHNKCERETANNKRTGMEPIGSDGMSFNDIDLTGIAAVDLVDGLNNLSKAERDCIESFYQENMTYAQIAQKKKLSIAEVKQHIRSGTKTIKSKSGALKT